MLDEQIRVGMGEKFLGKYDGKWNLSKDTVAFQILTLRKHKKKKNVPRINKTSQLVLNPPRHLQDTNGEMMAG